MADNLVDDYDVIDVIAGLAERCVNLLGVSAAGVMLAAPDGDLRVVASSSEAMRVPELFELQAQKGPWLDAFRTGEPVEHETCPPALAAGRSSRPPPSGGAFQSVCALADPFTRCDHRWPNLFNVEQTPMRERDLIVARALADLAAISVLQHRATTESQRLNEQLAHALTSRIVIEQAKGDIAERAGCDLSDAFSRLRNYNRRRTDVAQAAIDHILEPQTWDPTPFTALVRQRRRYQVPKQIVAAPARVDDGDLPCGTQGGPSVWVDVFEGAVDDIGAGCSADVGDWHKASDGDWDHGIGYRAGRISQDYQITREAGHDQTYSDRLGAKAVHPSPLPRSPPEPVRRVGNRW